MAAILMSVAATVAGYLVDPIVRPLGYLFNYRSNLDELEEQVETLDNARERLQHAVDEANRQGYGIENDVRDWLTRTEEIIQRARKLIEDENAESTSCLCFNLKLGYQRSRQAKELSGDIGKLQEEKNNFPKVAFRLPPQGIRSARLRDCKALESRASTLNEILEALRDDDIWMIGVWGVGGVGKTTLAYQVAGKAEEDKLFEKVVMALNISRVPNVTKIQGEIASMLGLKFEEEEESGRAALSRKSNEGWIFLGIKQGLQGFCLDFLGNQTRMNFPGNRMGDGFSWESNGGCKNNNNNMIRLVPARIESGRGK